MTPQKQDKNQEKQITYSAPNRNPNPNSDLSGPLCPSTQMKYLTFKGWEESSRLRDEMTPHAGEVRRAPKVAKQSIMMKPHAWEDEKST